MIGSPKPRSKSAASRREKLTYRGVTLQTPVARSQFTSAQIKRAVEDAIAKYADRLASGH
jgi:hypothetical protein